MEGELLSRWRPARALPVFAIVPLLVASPAARAGDELPSPVGPEWREMPELVGDLSGAPAGVRVIARRAWADPVGGRFLVVQLVETSGPARPATVHRALADALTKAGLTVGEPALSADESEAELVIRSGDELIGSVRTIVTTGDGGAGRARSAACLYNQRDARASRQLCERELQHL